MCRWLSYRGDPVYLEHYLFDQEFSLIEQSLRARNSVTTTNGDGFGVGWYGTRDEPGLFREVLPAWNDNNLKTLAHHIQAPLFFAHVRASTGTETMRANCHPFAVGNWMFMHNGQIGSYERIRRDFDNTLSDDLYAHRAGNTDSEAIFLHFLSHLPGNGPKVALEKTIHSICELMKETGIEEAFRMTVSLSDGENLYAARFSSDPKPPSLYYQQTGNNVIVVSEPLDDRAEAWRMLAPGTFLTCTAEEGVMVEPLAL